MFKAFSGVIKGRVQGVGFRYSTKIKADELQLTGWVRNLPDGTVEIIANGSLLALEQFMHYLKAGPIGSQVESAEFRWLPEPQKYRGFEILG